MRTKAITIFILSLALRIYWLRFPRDFWHDEAFTVLFAQKPLWFILAGNDVHPPLYTLVMKLFVSVSTNPIFLRCTSILFWCLFFYAMYHLLKPFGNKATLWCLLLLSISPTMIHFSTEVRNYMLALFFVAMQLRAFRNSNMLQYYIWTVLMLYTHYFTALVLLPQLVSAHRKIVTTVFLPFSVVAVTPLIAYLAVSLTKLESFWFKPITYKSFLSTISYMFVSPDVPGIVITLIILAALLSTAIAVVQKKPYWHLGFFMAVSLVWLVSQLHPIYHHRFFLFVGLFLYIGLAVNAYSTKTQFTRVQKVLLYTIVLLLCVSLYNALLFQGYYDSFFQRSAAVALRGCQETHCVMVHYTTFSQSPMRYYLPQYEHILVTTLTAKQLFSAGGSVAVNIVTEEPENCKRCLYVTETAKANPQRKDIFSQEGLTIYAK